MSRDRAGTGSLVQTARGRLHAYYFRKLTRYLEPREYQRVKALRASANPQMRISELLFLRWAIRRLTPQTAVEIGACCGASTVIMADLFQQLGSGRIYAIDLFSLSPPEASYGDQYHKSFDEAMRPYKGWFEKVEGDSKTVVWDRSIDFLLIDGDHSLAAASADIARYTSFLRPGGYVFLHDYVDVPEDNSMVKSAVDRTLMRDGAYRRLGLVNTLIGFEKVAP